jgi:hypothetical protein
LRHFQQFAAMEQGVPSFGNSRREFTAPFAGDAVLSLGANSS